MISAREEFCAVLYNGPLSRADAIVLLAGEDWAPRVDVALGLFQKQAAPLIVVTGSINDSYRKNAESLRHALIGRGLFPDKIVVDNEALNTREQAVNIIDMAVRNQWGRILLVASAYHLPRATLTFIKRLKELDLEERISIVPVPAFSKWFAAPDGMDDERVDLLAREAVKIEAYEDHVATPDEGVAYMRHWES